MEVQSKVAMQSQPIKPICFRTIENQLGTQIEYQRKSKIVISGQELRRPESGKFREIPKYKCLD